jgi:PAS domain S-box-containing protein
LAKNPKNTTDSRIEQIKEILLRYNLGDYSVRAELSKEGDDLDAIIVGLNSLGDELMASGRIIRDYEKRISDIMNLLLKYTLFDFSEKMEVSPAGDEIDAIAVGLNTLAEELQAKVDAEKKYTQDLEKLAIILETTADAVTTTSPEGVYLTWNKSAETIYGYSAEEMIGRKAPKDFVVPEEKKNLDEAFEKAKKGEKIADFQTKVKRKDGTLLNIAITITPIIDEHGKLVAISGISRDVTKQKKTEEALRESEKGLRVMSEQVKKLNNDLNKNVLRLEDSNSELEAFTYSVSHDLRAPLRAIHGYTKVLSKDYADKLDAEALEMMDAVMNNAKRMGQLIDDLLALSRLGRKDLQKRTLDMTNVAKAVINDLQKNEEHQNTNIILHPLPEANADFGLITQVFTNLLSNAVKYSARSENPRVEVGAKEDNGQVIYYVKDNGAGFDMKYYNKLFGVFQRLHDAGEFEGTGVGLAIVKRIIGKHGGRIWAEAEPQKGATFYFTLTPDLKPQL